MEIFYRHDVELEDDNDLDFGDLLEKVLVVFKLRKCLCSRFHLGQKDSPDHSDSLVISSDSCAPTGFTIRLLHDNFLSYVFFGVYLFDYLDCANADESRDLERARSFCDITGLCLDREFDPQDGKSFQVGLVTGIVLLVCLVDWAIGFYS